MLLFDWLIATRPILPHALWGPIDTLFHGLIALWVVLPVAAARRHEARSLLSIAFLAATLIDLDHLLAAGSLSLSAATSLPCRPWSHSLTFAAVAAWVIWMVTRQRLTTAVVASALATHVLRDASGGGCTRVLWPLAFSAIPYSLYLILTVVLGWWMVLQQYLESSPRKRTRTP